MGWPGTADAKNLAAGVKIAGEKIHRRRGCRKRESFSAGAKSLYLCGHLSSTSISFPVHLFHCQLIYIVLHCSIYDAAKIWCFFSISQFNFFAGYASSRHSHISLEVEHPTMRYMLSSVIVAEIQLLRSTSFSSQSTVVSAPLVADELLVSGLPSLIKFVTFIT
ncbi:PREDICTED: uncharacterized protein LOC109221727 [Nicotiana attenuata]|uniref:uncharacterized protein LOC109221727 n=1 Tax=Nicotiana attenuata TaxID=49451 RepID=UPI000904E0DA|nr:PREDICTED: uncharacterized protein LOC109221727 [Nicotiana attenuata]